MTTTMPTTATTSPRCGPAGPEAGVNLLANLIAAGAGTGRQTGRAIGASPYRVDERPADDRRYRPDEKDDAEVVIRTLFTYWMERPSALPHQYQEKAQDEPLARGVCDYIAGMTDNFIYEQYERFCR